MDKEAYDNFKEFVDQLVKQQYLSTVTNTPPTPKPRPVPLTLYPQVPGDLLGELYIGKDGSLYFHSEKAGENYKDDILIESVNDIKKIKTKKLLKT